MTNFVYLWLVLVLLLLSSSSRATEFFEPTDILLTSACTALIGSISTGTCIQKFEASVRPYKKSDGSLPIVAGCCALATLRSCLLEDIKENCGTSASGIVDQVIKEIAGNIKEPSYEEEGEIILCDGDEFLFQRESPLCWTNKGLAAVGILVVILLLMGTCACCCICCLICCCRSPRKQPILLKTLPTRNPLCNSSPPYSQMSE